MKKIISILAILLYYNFSFAQNIVLNPSFENTYQFCPTPIGSNPSDPLNTNGEFELLNNWVFNWTSDCTVVPGAIVNYRSGKVRVNGKGLCGSIPFSPSIHGAKNISIMRTRSFGTELSDGRAKGKFTTTFIAPGNYNVYAVLASPGSPVQYSQADVEAVLTKSGNCAIEKIIATFSPAAGSSWLPYNANFTVLATEINTYDRIDFRIKAGTTQSYEKFAYIDTVSITLGHIINQPPCDANFNYTLYTNNPNHLTVMASNYYSSYNYRWFIDGVYKGAGVGMSFINIASGSHVVCLEVSFNGRSLCRNCITVCMPDIKKGGGLETLINQTTTENADKFFTLVEKTKDNNTLKVYPNPAINEINFTLNSEKNESVTINIFEGSSGKIIYTFITGLRTGDNLINVNCDFLKSGTYFLEAVSAQTKKIGKFIIVK